MDHETALAELGATEDLVDPESIDHLLTEGWVVIEDVVTSEQTAAMRAAVDRMLAEQRASGADNIPDGGAEMVFGLVAKDPAFAPLVTTAKTLAFARAFFAGRAFAGGNVNFRSPLPGCGLQGIHSDTAPIPEGEPWPALHIVYAASDLRDDDGATRFVPGSHLRRQHAHEVLENPFELQPGEIRLTAREGAAVLFIPSAWHGGAPNTSGRRRYAMFGSMGLRDAGAPLVDCGPVVDRLPEAARSLVRPNGWMTDVDMVNPYPCWCCGVRRTCHPKGRPDPEKMDRDSLDRPFVHAREMCTDGFAPSEVL